MTKDPNKSGSDLMSASTIPTRMLLKRGGCPRSLVLGFAEVVNESAQRRKGCFNDVAVGRVERVQGSADSLLVGAIPIEQLTVPGSGDGDHGDPPIVGARAAVDESGVDELLNEATDRIRGKPEQVREFADSAGLVVRQGHQHFDLRHR